MKHWPFRVSGAIALGTVIASCLDPTEIDLQITTNVTSAQVTAGTESAAILVGDPATFMTSPSTSIATGAPKANGYFGDLVIVPSAGANSTVAIEVALGVSQPTSTCVDPNVTNKSGCIISTRQLQYVPHHDLVLPILLDSACIGKQCNAGQTCVAGQCVGDVTECDGGSCVTENDGGASDATSDDVFDSGCAASELLCNGACTNVSADPANCGGCGVDCTGGTCAGGTCTIGNVGGACLAVYDGSVYVITTNSALDVFPTKGGTPTASQILNSNTDIQSIGSDMALSGTTLALVWTVEDYALSTSYDLLLSGGGQANRVAIDNLGIGWFDSASGGVWYWKLKGPAASLLYTAQGANAATIAAADGILYLATGSTLCRANTSTCLTSTTAPSVAGPTEVVVSDATSSVPTIYDVEGSSVFRFPSDLSSKAQFATGNAALGAIAYDNSTSAVYAITTSAVYKAAYNTTFATVATTSNAATRCIAVDATAVYWVTSTGVYKHAK
jgi:hypothetical protein